jgi:hypothetical protein
MMNKRIIKIASVGEHRRLNRKAQIRLEGMWLVKAGLTPEKHVEITNPKPGVLILRLQD